MRRVLTLLLAAGTAHAEPMPGWVAVRGTLAPARLPGSYVLTGDAAPARYSDGELVSEAAVPLPYRLDVVWRRLGPEGGRSMHVQVVGGVVLIKTGKISFYAYDDTAFAATGWLPLPGVSTHDEHAVSVSQDRRQVVVVIDGKETARFPLAVNRDAGKVGVGMKGASGFRTSIYLRSIDVRSSQ